MAQKKEYVNLTSPLLVARYPKLEKQDVYDGKEVGFKVGGTAHKDEDFAKFKAQIEAACKTLAEKAGKNPSKLKFTPLREDKEGNEFVEFKSYKRPILFAPKGGVKMPESTLVKIGGGSVIRLKVSLTFSNGGVTGYMNAVQLFKLVERNGDGFGDLDGADDLPVDDSGFDDAEDDGDGLDL